MSEQKTEFVTISFVKHDLKVRKSDFSNPLVPMLLAQIELVEIKYGEGLIYYKSLKENYKIGFEDAELDNQIRKILIQRPKAKK